MNNFLKHTHTIHTSIITKTQIALQAIKNYEARQYQQQKQRKISIISNTKKQQHINQQKYRQHKQIIINKIYRIQIFPFYQQYYFINTISCIFPIRLFVKNVKNSGTVFVGYDLQFPGIDKYTSDINYQPKQIKKIKKNNFSDKFEFDKDTVFILKNQKKRQIKRIYFSIIANSQLLMFNLKFDYIGYQGMSNESLPSPKPKQQLPTIDQKLIHFFQTPPKISKQSHLSPSKQTQTQQSWKRSKTQDISHTNQKLSPILLQYPQKKNYLKINLIQIKKYTKQNQSFLQNQRKQKLLSSIQKNKNNKQQLQLFKSKQKQLKQFAFQLKQSINNYQNLYKKQKQQTTNILKLFSPIIYLNIFIIKTNYTYSILSSSNTKIYQAKSLTNTFIQMLKQNAQSQHLINNFARRNQFNCFHVGQLSARILSHQTKIQAQQKITQLFQTLQSGLLFSQCFPKAIRYRQAIRTIQKKWQIKLKARFQMLLTFSQNHIQSMFKQYPHLKLGLRNFQSAPHCYTICSQYQFQQTKRFQHVYQTYKKKLKQIQQYLQINQLITQYNKDKPQNKKKQFLIIPTEPSPPQHQFFRNLDFLKSMLRGWFQMEYKKILKKSVTNS